MSKDQTMSFAPGENQPRFALTQFTFEEFERFWPELEAMLDRIPHTWKHFTKDYILYAVENDRLQVWGIGPPPKAVLVFFTQISVYPADKVLVVPWGAGHFEPEMMDTIEAALINYAQLCECSSIEVRGRPGWEPHFKSIGMKREYITWSYQVPRGGLNG